MDIKSFLLTYIPQIIIVKDESGKVIYKNKEFPIHRSYEQISGSELYVPSSGTFYQVETTHQLFENRKVEIKIYTDITDHKNVQKKAYLDQLTGAYNRTGLFNELSKMKNHYNNFTYLVIADLDRFKKINDEFGHIAGDEVLKQVTKWIEEDLKETDLLCRYGGDEFLILLNEKTREEVELLLKKINDKIKARKVLFHEIEIPISVTFGTTEIDETQGIMDLINQADQKMYENKKK